MFVLSENTMIINNIYLIGTSHVAEQSINQVKNFFKDIEPDIIALELDPGRLYSLTHNVKRPKNQVLLKNLGVMGFLFYLFGEFAQKKIGNVVKIEPGSEMLTALKLAKKNKIDVALIDKNIQITLRRFSKKFKKREVLKMIADILSSPFKKNNLNVDFKKVPDKEIIDFVLKHTKKRYPSLYKVLIQERDLHMARLLNKISEKYPDKKIMAVVGAGHVDGITKYLRNF